MKKTYFLFILLMFAAVITNAQLTLNPNKTYVPAPKNAESKISNKTISCLDTVWYPQSKTTNYLADTMDYKNYIGAVSQNYHFTGSGSIHGISAYMMTDNDGIPANSDSVSMVISIRDIAGGVPTTIIASDTVFVYDVGYAHQDLMFKNPVTVNDSFAIVVEIDTLKPSNPYYITNDYGDGNTEALSSFTSASVWYNILATYPTWDVDMILSPIIEIDITASYTIDEDTVCPNEVVVFTNTSTNNTDVMFNLFNTTTNPLYTWDFNDGSGTYNPFDTSYAFSAPGTYNTQLSANYYGYTLNCMDVSSTPIVVHDTAIANFGFTHLGGGVYQFSDSSSNANTFSWNFGDGSPVGNGANPTHTYTVSNNYSICLTVTDSNGCNVNSICKNLTFTVGVDDLKSQQVVNIYPIPANQYFNVSVPNKYLDGEIIVTDVVGKTMLSKQIQNEPKVKMTTENLASGIYFVSIALQGERVYTQRIVVDK